MPAATWRDTVATAFEGFATGAVTTAGTAAEKRAAFGKATARAGGVTTLFWCARPITDSAARGRGAFEDGAAPDRAYNHSPL